MPAAIDHIDTLADAHAKGLANALDAALAAFIASIDLDQLASALDDTNADHIRSQLAIILDLDDSGLPAALVEALKPAHGSLASFTAAIAAHAAADVGHSINAGNPALAEARDRAAQFIGQYLADSALALTTAIEAGIYGVGSHYSRAYHLRRSIGLTIRQSDALDVMRGVLLQYLASPLRVIPARTNAQGVRIPATATRAIDTRKLLASTRGHISAAQRQMLARALNNPRMTAADAEAILDNHAAALRAYRSKAVARNGIHELAETSKLTGWRIAQRAGALPADQRRWWQTAADEAVRHSHSQVATMNAHGVELSQPFQTPFGPRMHPPLEPNCRCKAVLR